MTTPIWNTPAGSIGSALNGAYYSFQFTASNAVNYQTISGTLPTGLSLTSNGLLSGNISVDPITLLDSRNFNFTIQALSADPLVATRSFTVSVVTSGMYVPPYTDQDRILKIANGYSYQINTGVINGTTGTVWRLSSGSLPPTASFSNNGLLSVNFGDNILPFTREQFINPNATITNSLSQASWDQWLYSYLQTSHENDYQFTVELSDTVNSVQLSYSGRILHLKPSTFTGNTNWFIQNQSNLIVDPNQWYYFVATSDRDYIVWDTGSDLGTIVNGTISEKTVSAVSTSNIVYQLRPTTNNRFPLGLKLQEDGLIVGRVSYRCYQDDPVNCPVNDIYNFNIRVSTTDRRTFTEKIYTIRVLRVNTQPNDNLYIRNFPPVKERELFSSYINDSNLFPIDLLYRPTDPWFGKNLTMRFLFAAGLNVRTRSQYEVGMSSNHYFKTLLFNQVNTAYSLDENLNIKYEVIYLGLKDDLVGRDPITGAPKSPPNRIDMRPFIVNYYVKNGQSYYIYQPNALENMRSQIEQEIGYYNRGLLPDWMTSVQPSPTEDAVFLSPIGYVPAVVLAYTKPGAGKDILSRISSIDWNQIRYEFDRYLLDNSLSTNYNVTTNSYTAANLTIFDNNQTFFDTGTTKFAIGVETYLDPESGDKYIKFPQSGAFI